MHLEAPRTAPTFFRDLDWSRLVAPLPALATAAAFALAWLEWGSAYATVMAKTIQLEFLVIHAGIFIGVFVLVPIESMGFRVLRWVAVALFSLLYGRGAFSLLGWHGVLMMAGIFVGTYGGFIVGKAAPSRHGTSRGRTIAEIGVRWTVSMLAYMLVSAAFGLPELVNEWVDLRASVALGALYFAILGAVECTALYPRIRGRAGGRPVRDE